jgi:hypothetical protein
MAKLGSNYVGTAGEYLVAAQLSLRGWLATVTIKNAPGVDVLAQHPEDGTLVAIQSKTLTVGTGFFLNKSHEEPLPGANRGHDWFALVHIKDTPDTLAVDYYVVPRALAATLIHCGDKHWLSGGRERKKHDMRKILPGAVEAYKGRWDLLRKPAAEAPVSLPEWVIRIFEEHADRPTDREIFSRARPFVSG